MAETPVDLSQLEALARARDAAKAAWSKADATHGRCSPEEIAAYKAVGAASEAFRIAVDSLDKYVVVLSLIEQVRAGGRDTARLDWLDERCEAVASADGQTHEANAWGVYGQCHEVRTAIDEEMESAVRRDLEAKIDADLF